MSKSFIVLACVAAAALILDIIIALCYNAKVARIVKKQSTFMQDYMKGHRHGLLGKDHTAFVIVTVLLGAAHILLKDGAWLKYVGLGLAALYFLFSVFRIIFVYVKTDGSLSRGNTFRKSFLGYVFTEFTGNRLLLYLLSSLALAIVWFKFF